MRFEDWDVLLFPKDCKVPVKEFKTGCHVVQDNEFAWTRGSCGMPTMTCFIPSLRAGTNFTISLHTWTEPQVSPFTKEYAGEHEKLVRFEARVFVDGRFTALSSIDRTGSWPQVLSKSLDLDKDGTLLPLRFPPFRSELLQQSYWSPADDIGRVKIVISEGFPRNSLSVPIERVKNLVAFSFQHAPIDILESSGIAWPNPSMWRRDPFNPVSSDVNRPMEEDGAQSHTHSPRRGSAKPPSSSNTQVSQSFWSSMPNTQALLQQRGLLGDTRSGQSSSSYASQPGQSVHSGQFTPQSGTSAPVDWSNMNYAAPPSSFAPSSTSGNFDFNFAEQCQPSSSTCKTQQKSSQPDSAIADYGSNNLDVNFQDSNNEFGRLDLHNSNQADTEMGTGSIAVPANTPTTLPGHNFVDELIASVAHINSPAATALSSAEIYFNALQNSRKARAQLATGAEAPTFVDDSSPHQSFYASGGNVTNFPSDLATSLTQSLLNQPHPIPIIPPNSAFPLPVGEVKSRKENRGGDGLDRPATAMGTATDHNTMRKVSHSILNSVSNFKQAQSDNGSGNPNPSRENSSSALSPQSSRVLSGVYSQHSGEFSQNLTNNANTFGAEPGPPPGEIIDTRIASAGSMGPGSDKGVKRVRHFTPAGGDTTAPTARDGGEHSPRCASPLVQVGFGNDMTLGS